MKAFLKGIAMVCEVCVWLGIALWFLFVKGPEIGIGFSNLFPNPTIIMFIAFTFFIAMFAIVLVLWIMLLVYIVGITAQIK